MSAILDNKMIHKKWISNVLKIVLPPVFLYIVIQALLSFVFWDFKEIFWNMGLWDISMRVGYLAFLIPTYIFAFLIFNEIEENFWYKKELEPKRGFSSIHKCLNLTQELK